MLCNYVLCCLAEVCFLKCFLLVRSALSLWGCWHRVAYLWDSRIVETVDKQPDNNDFRSGCRQLYPEAVNYLNDIQIKHRTFLDCILNPNLLTADCLLVLLISYSMWPDICCQCASAGLQEIFSLERVQVGEIYFPPFGCWIKLNPRGLWTEISLKIQQYSFFFGLVSPSPYRGWIAFSTAALCECQLEKIRSGDGMAANPKPFCGDFNHRLINNEYILMLWIILVFTERNTDGNPVSKVNT